MILPFNIIDIVLHIDKYLLPIIQQYGIWTYAVLFILIFCETGLIVTPFLPGDSLLFVAGTFAGAGYLDIRILLVLMALAAFLGNTVNYWIGKEFEMKILEWKMSPVRKEHLEETRQYFEKYGSFTIVIARFIPFIRTFAPFIAGIGKMRYTTFQKYNILGCVMWTFLFLLGGYLFGNLPIVQANFSLVVYGIVALSVIAFSPVFIRFFLSFRKEKQDNAN
jgi:membrane-associated protein